MRQALTFVLACTLAASGLHAQAEYDAVDGISEIITGNGYAIYIDDPKFSEAQNYRIVVTRRAGSEPAGPFSSGAYAPSEVFGDSRTGRFVLVPAELPETLYDSGTPDDPSDDDFASNLYRLTGISVDNPGAGYFGTSTVTVEGAGGPTLSWDVEVGRSAVSELTLTNGGSGYRDPPAVTIEGGGGSGAKAVATIGGEVGSIELTSAGSGYTGAPTVAITGSGEGATAEASFGGVVSSIEVDHSGYYWTGDNYPDDDVQGGAPRITIEGGGGSGAEAEVTAMYWYEGVVESVTITNGGSGYESAPDVTITSADRDGSPAYPDKQEWSTATGHRFDRGRCGCRSPNRQRRCRIPAVLHHGRVLLGRRWHGSRGDGEPGDDERLCPKRRGHQPWAELHVCSDRDVHAKLEVQRWLRSRHRHSDDRDRHRNHRHQRRVGLRDRAGRDAFGRRRIRRGKRWRRSWAKSFRSNSRIPVWSTNLLRP